MSIIYKKGLRGIYNFVPLAIVMLLFAMFFLPQPGYSYYFPFFQFQWPMVPYFNPGISGIFFTPYPYQRFSQNNTNYFGPFYNNSRGMEFFPFYTPALPVSMYSIFSNPVIADTYFRPDPQWRAGREAAPSPPSVPNSRLGFDTGEIRTGMPADMKSGTPYSNVVPAYVSRQLIVMFRPEASPRDRAFVLNKHNLRELRTSPFAGFTLAALSSFQSVHDTIERIAPEPAVLYAEPNYYRHAHLIPNDPLYKYQWHLPHMYTDWAWNLTSGSGVVVGLLDSGVSYRDAAPYALAPDLAGTLIIPGWDFINADANPDDDYGHGTHMCGCIAQTTNNLLGVAGVAFSATVMTVKVMDSLGNVAVADEVEGIYYAANNGAQVINMSFGGVGTAITEQTAVTFAYNQGITIFGSAGNAGSNIPEYPASYTECISVGAVQYDSTRPAYSNYGVELDLVAPGGNLSVDQNIDGYPDGIMQQTHDGTNLSTFFYKLIQGTSPATALASGVGAMVISKSTGGVLTPLQVRNILESTTFDLGAAGWDEYYGWGEINAYIAVASTP
ncbi:MAG: S8 family serine peptidase [bacterium]